MFRLSRLPGVVRRPIGVAAAVLVLALCATGVAGHAAGQQQLVGNLVFLDDFQMGPINWNNESNSWQVDPFTGAYKASLNGVSQYSTIRGLTLADCIVDVDLFNAHDAGVMVRALDSNNAMVLVVKPQSGRIYWHERKSGFWGTQAGIGPCPFSVGSNVHLTVVARGNYYEAQVNGMTVTTTTSATFTQGTVGLYSYTSSDMFDNLAVYAIPLF